MFLPRWRGPLASAMTHTSPASVVCNDSKETTYTRAELLLLRRWWRSLHACGGTVISGGQGPTGGSGGGTGGQAGADASVGGTHQAGAAGQPGSGDSAVVSDGSVCVNIDLATYDRSCAADADCALVAVGLLCSGSCGCPGSTISSSGMARYQAETSSVSLGTCPCVAIGVPRCLQSVCKICGFGPNQPSGCPDGG